MEQKTVLSLATAPVGGHAGVVIEGSSPIRVKMHAKDSIEPSGVDDSISANNVVQWLR